MAKDRDVMALAVEVQRLRRDMDRLAAMPLDFFPARLTSGTGPYAWTERAFDANGDRYDKPGGRFGTVTYSWAEDPNGASFTPPTEVWLKRRVVVAAEGPVYDIIGAAGGGSGGAGYVTFNTTSGATITNFNLGSLSLTSTGHYRIAGFLYGRVQWSFGSVQTMLARPTISASVTAGTIDFDGIGANPHPSGPGSLVFRGPLNNGLFYMTGFGCNMYFTIPISAAAEVTVATGTIQFTYNAGSTPDGAIYSVEGTSYATYQRVV